MATERICSIPDCGKRSFMRGWCSGHYSRWRRHGNPLKGRASNTHTAGGDCRIEGCARQSKVRGYCPAHYRKFRLYGDPLAGDEREHEYGARRRWLDQHINYDEESCLIFPFARPENGYATITLPGAIVVGAHRYVCEAAHGPAPSPDHEAAHSCGRGKSGCVNPNHLRWATKSENAEDKLLHGTDSRGEKNGHAKLTKNQVREIIALRGIETGRSLAKRFGVTAAQISNIQLRKQWVYPD